MKSSATAVPSNATTAAAAAAAVAVAKAAAEVLMVMAKATMNGNYLCSNVTALAYVWFSYLTHMILVRY